MLAHIRSFILQGIEASPCEIEVDLQERGMDSERVVGLPDTSVCESFDRVRSALGNSGYTFPRGKLLVNLAPANVRKEGPVYDLPIAVGILCASSVIHPTLERIGAGGSGGGSEDDPTRGMLREGIDVRSLVFAGELALDGRVRPVRGAIAMASMARRLGARGIVLPAENATEAAVVEEIEVFGVQTLAEVVGLMNGALPAEPHPPVDVAALIESTGAPIDFREVRGQEAVKRAITVAAAGSHNLLMLGPPGTGKSMMAKALPGVLPPMTADEALEVTRVYSAAGKRPPGQDDGPPGLVTMRPVRCPHHTASAIAVIGGGAIPQPGEISLAHHGVLFLDELAEFPRAVLDTLRQPLEDGAVTIARAHSSVRFPASFMLVAAMNPTPKGTMPETAEGRRQMERYLERVSGPLIDRIDIHIEVPQVPWKQLSAAPKGTSTAEMRARVLEARARQRERQGGKPNGQLSGRELDRFAPIEGEASIILGQAITELQLSARAYDKIRRISRTIADLEGSDRLTVGHIGEAVQYRLLDRRI